MSWLKKHFIKQKKSKKTWSTDVLRDLSVNSISKYLKQRSFLRRGDQPQPTDVPYAYILPAFSFKVHLLIVIKATVRFLSQSRSSAWARRHSLALLETIYSWQLQPSIGLLSCARLWWPCRLHPASSVWMTADKSPGLLLASPLLCNSTAGGECAFSYEAQRHKSTKDTGTNRHQIALKPH